VIRLGGYGVPVTSDDPDEIARAHVAFGYRAAYCPKVAPGDHERIAAIARAFAAQDVVIAEVPAWRGLLSPDPVARKAARDYVKGQLAIADEVGARCCATYIGSLHPGSETAPHPLSLSADGFEACVEAARDVVDAVKPKRARFALEMMQWLLPDSPEVYLDLIRAVDRPGFAAHLDPVNVVTSPRAYYDTTTLLRHCFDLLGPFIVSCHAKDILNRPEAALHLDEVPPGQGVLDYATYLQLLDDRDIPLMLEHLEAEQYPAARDYVKSVGGGLGIDM